MSGDAELRAWAKRHKLTYREAVRLLLDLAEGRDILALLSALKRRYEAGMTPMELVQLDILYSWLGHVFRYRAPGEWL